jgi:hypothetical protein
VNWLHGISVGKSQNDQETPGVKNASHGNHKLYRDRWRSLSRNISPDWRSVYEFVSGRQSLDYIPEDVYYTRVEPVLNYRPMSKSETCKALYDRIYQDTTSPKYC